MGHWIIIRLRRQIDSPELIIIYQLAKNNAKIPNRFASMGAESEKVNKVDRKWGAQQCDLIITG